MVKNGFIKELSMGLVLLLLSFCPVVAKENVDVFSQPISSDEPAAPHGMPILPHSVDLPSGRRGGSEKAPAGSAAARNRALRERSSEMMRQREEEREHKRARSQEIRRQAEEKREQLLQLKNGQRHDGTEYGEGRNKALSDPVQNNAGSNSAQPQSWLDEPGLSKSGPPESALPKTDFVNTSGGSKPRPVAVPIEEAVPAITQKHAQDLTVPESANGKVKSGRRGVSQLERAVNRVGKRAASRANSLGNQAVNRALTPVRRAVNTPIRF